MDNKQKLIKKAQQGDAEAQELTKLTYSELVLSDIHLSISLKMNKLANKHGIYCSDEKKYLNAIKRNEEAIDKRLYSQLGVDSLAHSFGNRADVIQDILKELVFLSDEALLKIKSECLIFQNKEVWNKQ